MSKLTHFVFDLDDTLFKEVDFVRSAYNYIGEYIFDKFDLNVNVDIDYSLNNKLSLFDILIKKHKVLEKNLSLEKFLKIYRNHKPQINLTNNVEEVLAFIKNSGTNLSLITDGRSVTQRNKINALNINSFFNDIIISEETGYEKPNEYNFLKIQKKYQGYDMTYIGDNTEKDFISPNKLGWNSVCILDDGRNIHKQNFDLESDYLPKITITNFNQIKKLK